MRFKILNADTIELESQPIEMEGESMLPGHRRTGVVTFFPGHPYEYLPYEAILGLVERSEGAASLVQKHSNTDTLAILVPRGFPETARLKAAMGGAFFRSVAPEYPVTGEWIRSVCGTRDVRVIPWFDFYIALLRGNGMKLPGIPLSVTVLDTDKRIRTMASVHSSAGDAIERLLPEIAERLRTDYVCTDHPFAGKSVSPGALFEKAKPYSLIFFPKDRRKAPAITRTMERMLWEPASTRFSGLYSSMPARIDTPCQKCLHCARICPTHLHPFMLAALYGRERIKEAAGYYPEECIECGLCTYVCPSGIPLFHKIKLLKKELGITS
jgi:ferredoxin